MLFVAFVVSLFKGMSSLKVPPGYTFMSEEGFLQVQAAAKAPEATMGSDHPVARNEKNRGISSTSLAYSPGTPWSPNPAGNVPVSCNCSRRDCPQL